MVEDSFRPKPLGVMAKLVWLFNRQRDLASAIERYAQSCSSIPSYWVDEMQWLAVQIDAEIIKKG